MKRLFDQQLAAVLISRLAHDVPGSAHVRLNGMMEASDQIIWDYARPNDFTIVSKDRDVADLNARLGAPPKLVLLALRNCSTAVVESALRAALSEVTELINGSMFDCLIIESPRRQT
jgi:predicted nuclease of predicted toxin-antitoxin system